MKNKYTAILWLLIVMFAIPNMAQAEDNLEHQYSLTPQSTEWRNYNAYELQEKLNIPREQVTALNTDDLLELVLDYPFIGDVYAFNTVEDGIETIRNRFEPLDELLKRDNVSEVVYDRYLNVKDTENIKQEILDENYENSLKINFLEFLLEKQEVYSQLTSTQINEITKKAIHIERELGIDSNFKQIDSVFKDVFDKEMSATSWIVYTPNFSKVEVFISRHKAIVNKIGSNIWSVNLTSKWGQAGLYKHNYGDDPYGTGSLNISNWQRK